jgi:hypothetical protein
MDMRFRILIIFIWISNIGFGQDFIFKWQVWPSFSKAFTVLIEKNDTKSFIMIKETGANDSIRKKINQNDCDTLTSFLDKYEFSIKGSTIYNPKVRTYHDTKLLSDTNWIQINGDSLRRELIWTQGYYFDKDSNKCYTEAQLMNTLTDGNTYDGEFIKSNITRTFSVYCTRMSAMDFKLNKMIYDLMIKYDGKKDYNQLKDIIDSDEPRVKN